MNTILTDDERIRIAHETESAEPGRDGYILPITYARAIEAAVLAKLREQEPVACVTVERLAKMVESLEGIDKSQPGYHWRKGWNDALRRAMDYAAPLPDVVPPGYKLVPVEPTQEMLAAGEAAFRSYCLRHMLGHPAVWAAMLAAAPEAPAPAGNWQQYAKEGETAQDVIERVRKDNDALLSLMVKDRAKIQSLRGALDEARQYVVNNRCDGDTGFADGVAAANRNVLQFIDRLLAAAPESPNKVQR